MLYNYYSFRFSKIFVDIHIYNTHNVAFFSLKSKLDNMDIHTNSRISNPVQNKLGIEKKKEWSNRQKDYRVFCLR